MSSESFFVPVPLTAARQKKFTQEGITAIYFILEHRESQEEEAEIKKVKGFLVHGVDEKDKVLSILKASELEIVNTGYDGMYLVKCQIKRKEKTKKPKDINVIRSQDLVWDGDNEPGFLKVTEKILFPVVKRKIIVHPHHKVRCLPIEDENFHIHLWSGTVSFEKAEDNEMPSVLFSTKIQCRDWTGWIPGPDEVPLEDNESGWTYGSYCPGNLYIFYDCFHYGDENELTIYRKILEVASKYIDIDLDPTQNLLELIQKEKRELRLRRFVDLCNNRRKIRLDELQKKFEDEGRRIENLRNEMLKQIAHRGEIERELVFLETSPEEDFEQLGEELDLLDNLNKITKIDILQNKISVFTSVLLCKDERTKKIHEIGEFRIDIDPTGQTGSGGIRFHNLTRKVNGSSSNMNAPHVYNDGHACLGNAEPTIVELIRRKQFVELVQYLIAFIETANISDSAGAYINKWPEVSEKIRNMLESKYGKKLEEIYI